MVLLGIGIVRIADTGDILTRYEDGMPWVIAGVAGVVIALSAGVQLRRTLSQIRRRIDQRVSKQRFHWESIVTHSRQLL